MSVLFSVQKFGCYVMLYRSIYFVTLSKSSRLTLTYLHTTSDNWRHFNLN